MAQGCHLPYSFSDREHFDFRARPERSEDAARAAALAELGLRTDMKIQGIFDFRDGMLAINKVETTLHGVKDYVVDCFAKRYSEMPLADQKTLARIASAKGASQFNLLTGLGNPYLSNERALSLPKALERVLKQTPGAPGLFSPVRSRESSWLSNLKNSGEGKADGIANEVIATAALIDGKATSRSGQSTLRIGLWDKLTFGSKLQAFYGKKGPIGVTDGESRSVFFQPKRVTVEADLVITRPVGLLPWDTTDIGIDFKLSTTNSPNHVPETEVEGVLVALQTGEIDAFHFVTNTKFDNDTVERVQEINRKIETMNRDEHRDITPIELFEHFEAKLYD